MKLIPHRFCAAILVGSQLLCPLVEAQKSVPELKSGAMAGKVGSGNLGPAESAASLGGASEKAAPSQLFSQLSAATKPMWRQLYRGNLQRSFPSRPKAVYALGALMTDLTLATVARDEQQLRNLVQDESAFEKALGIEEKMQACRQEILTHGEARRWEDACKAVESAFHHQGELLAELDDAQLYTVEQLSRWLRTWQIATQVVTDRSLVSKDVLAIGHISHINDLCAKLEPLAANAPTQEKCLRDAYKRLLRLKKLWTPATSDAYGRLRTTAELLKEALAPLLETTASSPHSP